MVRREIRRRGFFEFYPLGNKVTPSAGPLAEGFFFARVDNAKKGYGKTNHAFVRS
jgi:hypothetical protein